MEVGPVKDSPKESGRAYESWLTGQSISSLRMVQIEILLEKRYITWVSAVMLFSAEFQMEPLAPYVITIILADSQSSRWLV